MSSASTKRRHKRNAELVAAWRGVPIGQRVTVARDNGEVLKTITESTAFLLDGMHAMIRVEGVHGNTRLGRVTLGWNPEAEPYSDAPLPWNHRAEIQRLRAAMVHAMDDAGRLVLLAAEGASPGALARKANAIAAGLKAALEKK